MVPSQIAASHAPPSTGTLRLAAVLAGNGLFRLANGAGGALVGFYLADLARQGRTIDAVLVGALAVVANGTELVGAIPFGALADRVAPRLLLVLGAVIGAVATILFGISGLVSLFFLSRMMEGLAASVSGPALLTHLSDSTAGVSAELRARITSLFELTLIAGLSLGTLVGSLSWELAETGGFLVIGSFYLLVALLFRWGANTPSVRAAVPTNPWISLKERFAGSGLASAAVAWLAANAVAGLWLTHAAFQLSGNRSPGQYLVGRFTPFDVGRISLIYAALFALGIFIWGFAFSGVGRVRAMRLSLAGMVVASFFLFLLNRSENWTLFARGAVLAAYGISIMIQSGFAPTALAFLMETSGRGEGRGAIMGSYVMLLGLGTLLGAGLGAILARTGHIDGMLLGTVALAIVGLLSLGTIDQTDYK